MGHVMESGVDTRKCTSKQRGGGEEHVKQGRKGIRY